MNPVYQEYAFIVFSLMVGMMPIEKSLNIAKISLADQYPENELEAAKAEVIKKIETGFVS